MSYLEALNSLRKEVFSEPVIKEPVKQTGFIPLKQNIQQTDVFDLAQKSREWINSIKNASEEARKTARPKEGFAEAFSRGLVEGMPKETKAAKPVGEKYGPYIQRREEAPPSYIPKPSDAKTFKEAIDATESGGSYDTLLAHSQREGGKFAGVKISEMTIGELKNFANSDYGRWAKAELGYKATPMGRYQFVGTTLGSVAKDMGFNDNTVFTPEVQDAMFDHYLRQKIASGDTMEEKISAVRNGWEGFKRIPNEVLSNLISQYEVS